MKLGLISLGCAKNKIDSELFLGLAKKYQIEITNNINDADIIVVNTCGFIESSKQESLDTIFEVLDYQSIGKKIVVMGCLVERYLEDLKKEIPEVDYFIPIKNYNELHNFFKEITSSTDIYKFNYENRIISTPENTAYLRIGDGCNNKCNYCAIPLIRGSYRSRPFEDIMAEANMLADKGIKELTLIAQDTTAYGSDLNDMTLSKLLSRIAELNKFKWIRVLYLYPDEITLDLLETFKKYDSIVNYFDIPIQHANDKILSKMNRRGSKALIHHLITTIREMIPDAIIRTTLIVGFPGETKKEFDELKSFINEIQFEHLGVFTYSDEDDTVGFTMYPKVRQSTMEQRRNQIMSLQLIINTNRLSKLIGTTVDAIVDHYDEDINMYALRYYAQALDDVDGYIYVKHKYLNIGEFYQVTITDFDDYDLIGEIKEEE
ncbi:MAG: 30S ribosomal protein S12 methylthiotransferase RimO [Bacilli bacterium]|nr:30S ribosomal protein S12 methylthiotransferase RimO [Bacilli bacterium]